MYDSLGVLLTQFTSVTAYTSAGVDLKKGTPRRGLKARFIVSNYSGASAGHTWTPTVQGSTDNTTFYEVARAEPVTTTTAAQTVVRFVPFETSYRYVRTVMALSGTTGTPTISYKSDIGVARPG